MVLFCTTLNTAIVNSTGALIHNSLVTAQNISYGKCQGFTQMFVIHSRVSQSYPGYLDDNAHIHNNIRREREHDPFQIVSQLQVHPGSRIHQAPQVR